MHNVVVTGGSRGIGLAIARRLAAAGYNVIAVARRESDELRQAIRAVVEQGRGGLHFRAFDLAETDAIPVFVKGLRDEFGAIYGLVNNAGIGTEGLLATMHNSEIEALVRLNVLSPVILTKYVVRHMMADGAGRIVNMSSIIASTGYNGLSVYGATKAAATGFTRSLAREVGKLGITVNAIAPGFIDTELTQTLSDDQRKRIAGRSALRRLPDVDDVARMVEYLLGDGGRNITGSVLIDHHGAGAADAFTASIFCAGQRQVGAKNPQQHPIVIGIEADRAAVEGELRGALHGASDCPARGRQMRLSET